MTKEVMIWSYFPSPTDLGAQLHGWKEFVRGAGYSVDLENSVTGETVTIRLIEEGEDIYVRIYSTAPGELFDRVFCQVICALAKQTDYLKVRTRRGAPTEPTFKTTVK